MTTRTAQIAYVTPGGTRPFYYANAHEKDRVPVELHAMAVHDAREIAARSTAKGSSWSPTAARLATGATASNCRTSTWAR